MFVPQAIQLIQFKLGRRRDLDEQIRLMLDLRQEALEKSDILPWFLAQKIPMTWTMPVGSSVPPNPAPLPTLWLREHDQSGVFIEVPTAEPDRREVELTKITLEKGRAIYGQSSGQPKAYAIVGGNIQFFPAPDKVYTIFFDCYAKDVLPSVAFETSGNAATNLWLTHAPLVLVEDVVQSICLDLRDANGAQAAALRQTDAWRKTMIETIERMEMNQLRTMGEDN
jgi:hypothetical protein